MLSHCYTYWDLLIANFIGVVITRVWVLMFDKRSR
jgi:hypothetical protein